MLDISFVNIICTILNLLILYAVFKKFLFNRVDEILKQRQMEVDSATDAADKATEEARRTKNEDKISHADEEKEQILSEIKKQGYDEYDRIVNDARKKGEQIITEAKHNAKVEAERSKEVYAAELKSMVIDAATKIAATRHSSAEDSELYDKFISEAGALTDDH